MLIVLICLGINQLAMKLELYPIFWLNHMTKIG
jgi:hypothetical protein